jgi:8-oxo-dGTP pyrophosphatase MutT (NUDIX family)
MVIIQPSTGKMVIVHEAKKKYCFLPRGRKDIGETLQEAVLREAYEETGYRANFLPLYKYHHQPAPPLDRNAYHRPDTEPIYMTVDAWKPKTRKDGTSTRGGEYFITWFVGQIEENAVRRYCFCPCFA